MRTIISLAGLSALGSALVAMAAVDASKLPPASTQKGVTYVKDIKPILDNSCARCHSGDRPKARLRLDSLEGALKGSEHGPVVKTGNSAGSQMVIAAGRIGDQEGWMPPPENRAGIGPLTKEQLALIRAWIDQGAK